ncbi:hypothetical protein [Salidesulfovibrio onnuriiensis]|uniref:hypothetical protein n=1 Tax=Salidesulfovibrio onnuriiensis TaxID=2583823 RepID=UPI0011C850D6|nr:hypothetical protein [Salidesulfovibrio onnuriiensis]
MILNSNQLKALQQRNDEELRKGEYAKHGYPAHTIRDLLQTVESMKREKKKWKKLAQERGQALKTIQEIAEKMNGSNGD